MDRRTLLLGMRQHTGNRDTHFYFSSPREYFFMAEESNIYSIEARSGKTVKSSQKLAGLGGIDRRPKANTYNGFDFL